MKKKGLLLVGLLLVLCLFTLMGCGGEEEPAADNSDSDVKAEDVVENDAYTDLERKVLSALEPLPDKMEGAKIGVVFPTFSNPFYVSGEEGYKDAAASMGIEVEVVAGATEDDVEGQLNVFKTMIGKDYDAIIIVPITGMNLISGVVEANEKGIPIICSGTTLDEDAAAEAGAEIAAHMTYNFEEQGYVGAKYISEKIKAEGGENAKVAVIEGLAGAFQGEARRDGAVKAFKEAGMNIVAVQAGDWDRQKAFDIATNLIQSNPDLKGICCANDTMALGVVEALKVAGKKDQVYVTGIDFLDEARQSLKAGELDGSVAMAPYISGKGNLTLALKVLQNHDISEQSYYSPIALVTKENVNDFDDWK
ncbi:MAG: substrate-binding domain-containing protein [Syntrophaceticus sp.]|jgi:ABC-type sugar transport system substrate-binding protein|nr:substrate-binding domain-containing protein [Syntrophaceticus sp.]MDD3314015.1 substrate-binding domain-containing protein [Syntrophaceticus sp.]MDD4359324.1 substrate-binding domain-containing protein [Syntrophaceticus sp.]MDD4782272.1 substrate-binding domain-containing protein [Syntrophaceticus sp.]